jgi:hypothetical protein
MFRTAKAVAIFTMLVAPASAFAQRSAADTYQYNLSECERAFQFRVTNARDGSFKSREQLIQEARQLKAQCDARARQAYEANLKIEQARQQRLRQRPGG